MPRWALAPSAAMMPALLAGGCMNSLLKVLQDGRFHSGQELGARSGSGAAAVGKHLQRLEASLGIQLHKVPGRGHRLAEPSSLLDEEGLELEFEQLGWALRVLENTDPTNAEALRLRSSGAPPPFVVLAETQTSGRGRRGR